MRLLRSIVFPAMAVFVPCCAPAQASAQITPTPQGQVALSRLSPPMFPPLARVARVSGDVEIALRIRQDGTVESAEVASGHPLLKAAALDSARQSKFDCHECGEAATPYSILYTFGYTTAQNCCQEEKSPAPEKDAGITQSPNHITILADPFCICDPGADVIKVRSAKCLFLWHCSKRYGL
jgi:TonB family protein